tara:strand:+ start:462 stop:647 length:186 start_codon:yes stop_codon:yes gene_type:complete
MSKKIKIELTERQYMFMTQALDAHCVDIMAAEFIDKLTALENRVIENGVEAMRKGYEQWKN